MKFITFDLEMNMEHGIQESFEAPIIQLGYVIFNPKTFEIYKEKETLIKQPKDHKPIYESITKLTGITNDDVLNGEELSTVYNDLVKTMREEEVTPTPVLWGNDHDYLRKQLGLEWKDFVFTSKSIQVQNLYGPWALGTTNFKFKPKLEEALKNLKIEFPGLPHRALNDAKGTFLLYKGLVQRFQLAEEILKVHSKIKI